MRRKRWGDEGSATVWAVLAAMALCAVFAVVIAMAQAVIARHRAASAADLSALAAAGKAVHGAPAACGDARRVAAAQGARLVRCTVRGDVADVTARARTGPFGADIRARAGPPTSTPAGAIPAAIPNGWPLDACPECDRRRGLLMGLEVDEE
ncbi:Rv3654c family TadE-like protein [Streptomyces sp. NPDC017056]|uniref:Rv3654c family TadE-like protein n=2 Tax=unclassified Streptomyces TaxID=2593676 RepID=UPI00379FF065